MGKRILFGAYWGLGILLVSLSIRAGGWDLLVPAAVAAAAAAFGVDLALHRRLVSWDRELAQTFAHVLAAVVLAAFCLLWTGRLLLGAGG
jgi:hypothetical protein